MPPARALRAQPTRAMNKGNQRRGDQQHQARDHIHRKQQHGKCHRQHGGGGHGRQVFGEEAIQRLDLVHHGAGQHARGLAPTPVRPLVHQALEQGQAHLALDPLGGDGAGAFGPGDTGADQHQRGDAEDAAQQVRARRLPRDGGVQHAGQQPGLDHQQHAARERRGAGQQQAAAPIPPDASTIATARARARSASAGSCSRLLARPAADVSRMLTLRRAWRAGHANGPRAVRTTWR